MREGGEGGRGQCSPRVGSAYVVRLASRFLQSPPRRGGPLPPRHPHIPLWARVALLAQRKRKKGGAENMSKSRRLEAPLVPSKNQIITENWVKKKKGRKPETGQTRGLPVHSVNRSYSYVVCTSYSLLRATYAIITEGDSPDEAELGSGLPVWRTANVMFKLDTRQ